MDIIFGAAIAFCLYIVLKPMMTRSKGAAAPPTSESPKTPESPKAAKESPAAQRPESRKYTPEFIRKLNPGAPSPSFSIISKAPEFSSRHSPRPSDSRSLLRNYSPEPFEFSMRSPRTRLSEEEERQYEQSMRELTPDYCPFAADDLPKDIQLGRVHWKRSTSGRIHVQEPINGVRDIFFHLHDCELKPGEEIQLGDSVMFELALFEGRLCAVHVKKLATKVIPSPDFSRRVMKHSEEEEPKVDSLVL